MVNVVVDRQGYVGVPLAIRAAQLDPHASEGRLDLRATLLEATKEEGTGADLVINLTAHDAFDYDARLASGTRVLDFCHRPDGPIVEHL